MPVPEADAVSVPGRGLAPVTNRNFRRFVEATGYVTFVESPPDPKDCPGALPELLVTGTLAFMTPGRPENLRDFRNGRVLQRDAHAPGP